MKERMNEWMNEWTSSLANKAGKKKSSGEGLAAVAEHSILQDAGHVVGEALARTKQRRTQRILSSPLPLQAKLTGCVDNVACLPVSLSVRLASAQLVRLSE